MSSDSYICRDCGEERDYDLCRPRIDPRAKKLRTHCGICFTAATEKIELQAVHFNVAKNARTGGTSKQAAIKADKSAVLNDTHRKILELIRTQPSTPGEVSTALGLVLNTARARMTDLSKPQFADGELKAPWICRAGETRSTQAHGSANVMRAMTKTERAEWAGVAA